MTKPYAMVMLGLALTAATSSPQREAQAQSNRRLEGQPSASNAPGGRQSARLALPGISRPVTIPSNAPPRTSRLLSREEKAGIQTQLERELAAAHKQLAIIKSSTANFEKNCAECAVLEKQSAALQMLKRQSPLASSLVSAQSGAAPATSTAPAGMVKGHPSAANSRSPADSSPSTLTGSVARPAAGQLATNRAALSAGEATNACMIPQIYRVNGASTNVVFTQDPPHNDYIIEGCKFGEAGGQVYLSGAVANGRINMVVKSWSPSRIEAMVDPALAGVLDGWPDLIVHPANQPALKLSNCRFYAQRQTVLLKKIPLNSARLANVNVETEYCASSDQVWQCTVRSPLAGTYSNGVDRESVSSLTPGQDEYDLDSLAPGFVVDTPAPYWYGDSMAVCKIQSEGARLGDSFEYSTQGVFRAYKKSDRRIVVEWGVEHCAWKWMAIFSVSDFYSSGYSLQVDVVGPLCVDPWTGRPDQACIANLKKQASQH